jgi:hypothetical protein
VTRTKCPLGQLQIHCFHNQRRSADDLDKNINPGSYLSPALSPVPPGENFPFLHLSRFPQDVPTLCRLRPQVSAGGRVFSGSHVHQLWLGARDHRADRSIVVGHHRLVDYQRRNLGADIVPAPRSQHFTLRPRALDLSRPDVRSRTSTTSRVGADVLICRVERSSTGACMERKNSRAWHRRADEDISPLRGWWQLQTQRTSASCIRSLWVARNSVFLIVPSVVFSIPATVRSLMPW